MDLIPNGFYFINVMTHGNSGAKDTQVVITDRIIVGVASFKVASTASIRAISAGWRTNVVAISSKL